MAQMIQTKAVLRRLHMSPQKVRLLVDLIRGKRADDALVQLQVSRKSAARPVRKLLDSAIANAKHNYEANVATLRITQAFVDGGPMQYRWMPRAMGRATPIRKRTSHVTIVLEGEAETKNVKRSTKNKKADADVTIDKSKNEAPTKKV